MRAALAVQRAYWAMKERVKQRHEREAAERAAELARQRQEEAAKKNYSADGEQVRVRLLTPIHARAPCWLVLRTTSTISSVA